GSGAVLGGDRRIRGARRRLQAIGEALVKRAGGALVDIERDALAAVNEQAAQVVNAVGMVGMLMRIEHGVEPIDLGVKQLLAQIRRRIDQDTGNARAGAALDQKRGAAPAVLGIARIAVAPAERWTRHAAG